MKINLGKLEKIELRKVWNHEAYDFTNWLAEESNLSLLSDEIGVDIKLIETEASVGKFNVDILAEEENTGRKIIIENQLETTDHDHLGKVVTYASGYDAEIIIWIVNEVRDEHKRAIDWLNEHTDENINFFAIKMELWKIGDSAFAPKFQIISKPNDWAKTIKAGKGNIELTDTKLKQLDFWKKLKDYITSKDKHMKLRSPRPQHWYNFSMGSSDAHIALTLNTKEDKISCEIYINRNKELYKYLENHKNEIEGLLGENALWIDAPIASRVIVSKNVASVFSENQYEQYFEWMYEKNVLFQKVFGKYLKDFRKEIL